MNKFGKIIIFFSILLGASCVYSIDPQTWSKYDVESFNVDVSMPREGRIDKVRLQPLLIKPKSAPPWSSIVLRSNSTGLEDRMWKAWVPAFLNANIAVILVDSFNPRGFSSTEVNQFLVGYYAKMLDAHTVLDYLIGDDRFIKNKMALGGHSNGAETAFHSSYKESLSSLNRTSSSFNAFIAAASPCLFVYKKTELNGPLLGIIGSMDDAARPDLCKTEFARLRNDGQPAELVIIEGANHEYSTKNSVYAPRLMNMPIETPTTYIKLLSLERGKTQFEYKSGEVISINDFTSKYSGFLGSKMYGYHVGGDFDKIPDVVDLSVQFLKKNGW